MEAVRRIDVLFAIQRDLTGLPVAERSAQRQQRSAPAMNDLEARMREARVRLSCHSDAAKATDLPTRWESLVRFLSSGRICLRRNAAERALRGIAIGRKVWLLAGSDRVGERAEATYSLIATAKLYDVDPRA